MRRVLAIFVLLALALPLALPAFAPPPVGPHACCRRGAHLCHSTPSDAPAVSGISRCCRCYQSSPPRPCEPEAAAVVTSHTAAAPADVELAIVVVSRRILASSGRAPPAVFF